MRGVLPGRAWRDRTAVHDGGCRSAQGAPCFSYREILEARYRALLSDNVIVYRQHSHALAAPPLDALVHSRKTPGIRSTVHARAGTGVHVSFVW